MSNLEILQIPVLQDNYIYVVRDIATETCAVVDPAESEPVLSTLRQKGWKLNYILNTHHHGDHVGGNLKLKSATGAQVVGHRADAHRIPGIDILLQPGDSFALGKSNAKVLAADGHTIGHIMYWFRDADALFCGDTLFSLGCGRLFEGSAAQMWHTLEQLAQLPPETFLYCAHEYTENNAQFALRLEPNNQALIRRAKTVKELRSQNKSTVPSQLGAELDTNPFLRPHSPEIRQSLQLGNASDLEVFAEIRHQKDLW